MGKTVFSPGECQVPKVLPNPFVACSSQTRGIAFSPDFSVFPLSTISQDYAGFGTFCDIFVTRRGSLPADLGPSEGPISAPP
jgi:hypothetical protein